MITKFYAIRG